MSPGVKRRPYDSSRRRQQAAATRLQIMDAAERLFVADGYGPTTVAAIAREAGVAAKTVYLAFETKSGVLRALWNLRLRGDDDQVPVVQRAWYREVLEEADPQKKLRLNARNARSVKERIGVILGVVREAAAVDADCAALWGRIEDEFHENQSRVVATLEAGALRDGLGAAEAADVLWTLNHPEVWQMLVGRRGWSAERWERWFAEASCRELLGS